jgi:cytochrome c oxidase subunit IV
MAKSAIIKDYVRIGGMLRQLLSVMAILAIGSLIVTLVLHAFRGKNEAFRTTATRTVDKEEIDKMM